MRSVPCARPIHSVSRFTGATLHSRIKNPLCPHVMSCSAECSQVSGLSAERNNEISVGPYGAVRSK